MAPQTLKKVYAYSLVSIYICIHIFHYFSNYLIKRVRVYRYCTCPFFLSCYCLFCPQTLAFWGGQRKVCKAGRHTEARPFGRELRGCPRYRKRQPWLNWVSWHTLSLQRRLSSLFHSFFLDPTVNLPWRVLNYARELRFFTNTLQVGRLPSTM